MDEDLPSTQDEFAVRFHLHPTIKANRLSDGHGVMLILPDREAWTFNAYEDMVELEESVYLGRTRWPAAHHADGHLRPCPQSAARELDLYPGTALRSRTPAHRRGTEASVVI